MKEQNEIGDIFRNAFDGYEIEPSNKVWNSIKNNNSSPTPQKQSFNNLSNLLKISASIVIVAAIVFVVVKTTKNKNIDNYSKPQTTVQNINEKQIIQETHNINKEENNTLIEKTDNRNDIVENQIPNEKPAEATEVDAGNQNTALPNITKDKKDKKDNSLIDKKAKSTQTQKQIAEPIKNSKTKSTNNTSITQNHDPVENANENVEQINAAPEPVYIKNERYICFGEDAILSASYGNSYKWNNGSTLKTIKVEPVNTTVYTVSCTNEKGHVWIENLTVNVDRSCTSVFAPNAFTPDGDGNNDVFMVYGTSIKEFSIIIFSRRNSIVFESDDINVGWDGTYRGQKAAAEVYYYKINYIDGLNNPHRKEGIITLIK